MHMALLVIPYTTIQSHTTHMVGPVFEVFEFQGVCRPFYTYNLSNIQISDNMFFVLNASALP